MQLNLDGLFSQRVIAELSGVSLSTVNRFIVNQKIPHVEHAQSKIKKYSTENTRAILRELFVKENPAQKKVQVFYNFKGGTGKTSLCYQTACYLAIMGYNVLTFDLDPQGHLSRSLNFEENGKYETLYDVIINGSSLQDVAQPVFPGLTAVPSNLALTRIEVPLSQKTRREEVISKIIAPVRKAYDFILIDTNPTISTLNMNALVAADRINVVCETQPYSLAGLGLLVEEMERFFEDMQLPLNYQIVANKYEAKTATAQEVLGVLRMDYRDSIMDTVIRKSEDINIASKKNLPVCASASVKSAAFEDIRDFVHEVVSNSK